MNLKECKEKLKTLKFDDPQRAVVLKEKERIEQWMIKKGYKKEFKYELRTESSHEDPVYPWHVAGIWVKDIWMISDLNGKGINYEKSGEVHICAKCKI